ncbi:MAG: glycosyltransferase [Bacteroidetes bacterium]|nr:MAG: glycosyltransferase [Bacteroidota bacterium]
MRVWVNCIVRNEENFIWFAIMSVVDYVDKVLVWDSGSTDKTVRIIKEIIKRKKGKIEFKEVGPTDKYEFTKMRQAMLNASDCDWILILDGDEVWWKGSIKQVIDLINKKGDDIDAIAVPFYNVVGDIYHYQSESSGRYELLGRKGHLTIRAINRKIPGLHVEEPYGKEGYYNGNGLLIQESNPEGLKFSETPFMHLTHLKRSSHGQWDNKYRFDYGIPFSSSTSLPEVFYKVIPKDVRSPFNRRGILYELIARFISPFIYIKRRLEN